MKVLPTPPLPCKMKCTVLTVINSFISAHPGSVWDYAHIFNLRHFSCEGFRTLGFPTSFGLGELAAAAVAGVD